MNIAGFTSTGSKHPVALYGGEVSGVPLRMVRSDGYRVWADDGREYRDFIMALGAVALGYGHAEVNRAAIEAIEQGAIGPLAPVLEEALAQDLVRLVSGIEQVRFLKTGAEAVAAAVRLARASTGRDQVLGCGYHGWLDWCSQARGVPRAVQGLFAELEFNDPQFAAEAIRRAGTQLACVVVEPVVDAEPTREWLRVLRDETHRVGALLVFDEMKTAFRVAIGGAAARWGGEPDLVVLGKALSNGFPLAAVGGKAAVMRTTAETWISSTTATEFVSLAAARATLRVVETFAVPQHLARVGGQLLAGLDALAGRFPGRVERAGGIPEMCYLRYRDAEFAGRVAQGCARQGLLFKKSAYNFVSLAHDDAAVTSALDILGHVLSELG